MQEQRQAEQQQQSQLQQQEMQSRMQSEQKKQQQLDTINQRDNETKILVAQIAAQAKLDSIPDEVESESTAVELARKEAELSEKIRQFNAKQKLAENKLSFD